MNNTHHFLSDKAKSFFVDIEEKDSKAWNGYYKGQVIHDVVNFKTDVSKLLEAKRLMNRLMKFQFGGDA